MTVPIVVLSLFLLIQTGTGSIEGTIVNALTNEPVPAAQITGMKMLPGITIQVGPRPQIPPVTSDSNGHFILENLEAGTYTLRVGADGYARQQFGPPVAGQTGMSTSVTLSEGQGVKGVTFHLMPAGNVSGRITGSSGLPLANIEVALLRVLYDADSKRLIQSATAQTDDRGEYRLFWVPPGQYYLSAGSPSRPMPGRNPILGQAAGNKYARTFYPATTDPAAAVAIDIQPGGEVSGIDFRLSEQATYRIRGRVIDSAGQVHTNASISITPRSSIVMSGGSSSSSPYNGNDGTFELRDVPSGSYWVVAQLSFAVRPEPGSRPPRPPTAVASVDVAGSDVDGVVLSVLPPINISGRGRIEGQASGSNIEGISVMLSTPQRGPGILPNPFPAKINPDGTFQIDGVLPGEYRVNVVGLPSNPQSTIYLKEARFGSIDALTQTFTISSPSSDQLEIVFARNAGQINGTVSDNRPQPQAGVQVALIPDRRERRDLYKFTFTDASGRFTFTTVPPGAYRIFTVRDLEPNAFVDPEVIRRFEQDGNALTVGESSNITVDLKLNP